MKFLYRKKLTPTEAKRHYIYVDKKHKSIFPTPEGNFKIIIDHDRVLEARIDTQGRIYSRLFEYISLKEGNTVVFAKNPDGSFNVTVK